MKKKKIWLCIAQLPSVTACVLTLVLLQACARGLKGDFCALYIPVYTADSDSAETRAQTDLNNAVWLDLCRSYAP